MNQFLFEMTPSIHKLGLSGKSTYFRLCLISSFFVFSLSLVVPPYQELKRFIKEYTYKSLRRSSALMGSYPLK